MSTLTNSIGGFLPLELPAQNPAWITNAYKFVTARCALSSLIEQLGITSVWLPRYLCDSIINPLADREIALHYYDLSEDLSIDGKIGLKPGEVILYVNYFGLCRSNCIAAINRYGKDSVIIDNSQAFFDKPSEALATIYSPRKFFGLPDGGLLFTKQPGIREPEVKDNTSIKRMGHLLDSLSSGPETSYDKYLQAEESLGKVPTRAMSELTELLLRSIDLSSAQKTRGQNASYLHKRLQGFNKLEIDLADNSAPLCYPLLPATKMATRQELIKKRLFLPNYWPEVLGRVPQNSLEWELVTKGLFLPCDQRYTKHDMDTILKLLDFQ